MEDQMKVLDDASFFKQFPNCPRQIPMRLLNEEWAQRTHDQSLARLNKRGGMCVSEILANIERRHWKSIPDNVAVAQLQTYLKSNEQAT